MKRHYDIIFVVLVYRNENDLEDFFSHFHLENCKVIVVNSFYDEVSEGKIKKIAIRYDADFLSVPNNGYGAGNNRGCRYALDNYLFEYLVISNADIMIEKLDIFDLKRYKDSIIAPQILNLSNKKQNPSVPFKPSFAIERLRYWIYCGNHNKLIWLYFCYSRLMKVFYYCISGFRKKIFSAHGAFVIFPQKVVQQLYPFYNEEMFLFNEEEHLARHAMLNKINTYYAPEIIIRHKEDGSMNLENINEFEKLKQSYLVYYDYWIAKK